MRRKCEIVCDKRRCYWFSDFLALLTANGVEVTGKVHSQGTAFGWVEQDDIPKIRNLCEVAMINDDYAYLVQDETSP
jgi:hypothetical protein